jgi:hypothetical protein
MCWNESVSLNTFLFSSFVLTLIIYNNSYTKYKIQELNNTWMYIFIASFVFMQLIEFFIWRNINNKFYNNLFSILALLLLFIQPIAGIMLLQNIELRNLLLASYLLVATPYSIYEFSTKHIHTLVSKLGHLKWTIFQNPSIVWVVWLFFFLFSFVYEKKWSGFLFAFITLLISFVNYKNDQTMASMWCWSVNSLMIYYAIYLLIYLPFLEKQNIC